MLEQFGGARLLTCRLRFTNAGSRGRSPHQNCDLAYHFVPLVDCVLVKTSRGQIGGHAKCLEWMKRVMSYRWLPMTL